MNNNIKRFLGGFESEDTRISYESDLNQFFDFVNTEETKIAYGEVYDWKSEMVKRGYASATIARKLTAIKSYYDFLCKVGTMTLNPATTIKSPTIKNKKKDYVPMKEAKNLLTEASNPRDKAIIAIYLSTGMRVSELINLSLEQYNSQTVTIKIKGDRERKIYFNEECRKIVDEYIKVRKNSGIPNLFVSNHGTPMRRDCISKMLRKVAEKADIEEHISNHTLRHTYVSEICNEYGINIAKDVICHSDISTTQRYSHNTEETVKNVMLNMQLV